MQTIRTMTKDCGTQFLFHLAYDCSEMVILKLMVEMLQNWEIGCKSRNRGWERTKYVPEIK